MKAQAAPAVRQQSGASAVEFALLLPLLIMLSYGTIVYGYVFVVYESINYAAHQGAEAAIAVSPTQGNYSAVVVQQSRSVAAAALDWLPAAHKASSIGTGGSAILVEGCTVNGAVACGGDINTAQAVSVTIDFPLVTPPVFPLLELSLPGVGTVRVPPLPDRIRGRGVVLLIRG